MTDGVLGTPLLCVSFSAQMFMEGLVFGNATMEEAASLVQLITSRFTGASLEVDLRNTNRLVRLPYGAEVRCVRICSVD